MQGQLLAS